jgi:hypothetical protein
MFICAGTMSGGGKSVSKGRMGSSVVSSETGDAKQLADLEKQLLKVSLSPVMINYYGAVFFFTCGCETRSSF